MKKRQLSLERIIDFVGCVTFALLLVLTLSNIFCDWLFGRRYGQIEEIVSALFVWVVYVGTGVLYKNKEHISVNLFVKLLPEKAQAAMDVVVDVLSLAISGVITYYALILALKSVRKFTSVMKIPYIYIDFAVVVGFGTLVLYVILGFARARRARSAAGRGGEEGQ